MVQADIGNVLFGNQQKYYQLVFFVMTIEVIKKGSHPNVYSTHFH